MIKDKLRGMLSKYRQMEVEQEAFVGAFERTDDFWKYKPTLIILALLFFFFLLWSGFSEIDQHIKATGKIVPAGSARVIQHLEGGIVEKILVEEGQRIVAGDTLFLVANTKAKTQLRESKIQRQSLTLTQIRLKAELAQEDVLEIPAEFKRNSPKLVRAEMDLFNANKQQFQETIKGIEERMNQKRLEINALVVRIKNLKQEYQVVSKQLAIKEELFEAGAISEAAMLDTKVQARRLITSLETAKNQAPILEAEYTEVTSTLEESRQKRQSELGTELNEVQLNLDTLSERIAALSDQVTRSAITSPIEGIVKKLHIHTLGGVSQPGAPLAEIVPENETLIVEGRIATTDRGKVWPELKAMTKIGAYDYTQYGGINGELVYISPDSFIDNMNNEYYKVRVVLDSDRLDEQRVVRPGMTAEVSILTGKISILRAFLKPLFTVQGDALREA